MHLDRSGSLFGYIKRFSPQLHIRDLLIFICVNLTLYKEIKASNAGYANIRQKSIANSYVLNKLLRFNHFKLKISPMPRWFWLGLLVLSLGACCAQRPEPAVLQPPVAYFSASSEQGVAPFKVTFSDFSSGDITNWHWDFGDGQFSDDGEPVHTYMAAGDYTVSLAIMGPGGSDVETKIEYIKVTPGVIKWEEAASYIGQYVVVEGVVVNSYYAEDTTSRITFLDFHKPYDDYFKCIIWGSDRDKFLNEFPPDPETYFLSKHVRVSGLVEEYPRGSGVPEMVLKEPSQIELVE
jgi:PKD repeat protein